MDIADFTIIRSPRLIGALKSPLEMQVSPALDRLARTTGAVGSDTALTLATDFNAAHPYARSGPGSDPDSVDAAVFCALSDLSEFLTASDDRVTGADWMEKFDQLRAPYVGTYGDAAWREAMAQGIQTARDGMIAALLTKELPDAADSLRMLLLLGLVQRADAWDMTAAQTWSALNASPLHLPALYDDLFPQARVKLVREASVSDLYVVRSEWRCYVRNDIAGVKNVLPGESYEHVRKVLQEEETTATSETTTTTSAETETQSKEDSELSSETSSQLHTEINGRVQAELQQGWGTGSVKVSGGVEGRISIDQAQRNATRIARSSLAKAISRVDSMTREARMRRELVRTVDTQTEKIENSGDRKVRGVYRWLDRIDRYQVVRYPDRLQLEFQIPEPATYIRWRAEKKAEDSSVDKPPAWNLLDLTDIQEGSATLLQLAKDYHATALPSPPPKEISVVYTLKAKPETVPTNMDETVPVAMAYEKATVTVVPGYLATKVAYSARATPLFGKWASENEDGTKKWGWEGYHLSMVDLLIDGKLVSNTNSRDKTVKSGRVLGIKRGAAGQTVIPYFEDAVTDIERKEVDLETPAASLELAVQAVGVSSVVAGFTVTCERTEQSYANWRQSVYDALYDAWQQWKREWDAQQSSAADRQLILGDGSSTQVAEMMTIEIKRQVIGWLLDESPFKGRGALKPSVDEPPAWMQIDFDSARESAPTIQFFEQAFEWGSMNYVLYPYYWADKDNWDGLNKMKSTNPDLERFLRAGSARVVVPVRPSMELAMLHWLIYKEPFFGRPLPLPGSELYVSIAREIQDLTRPPPDGVPGESWEARVGTALMWLDDSEELPHNEIGQLGLPPHEPLPLLCPE